MGKLGSALKAGQTIVELSNNARDLHGAATSFRAADKRELGRNAGHQAFTQGADTGKTMGKTWLKTFEVIPRWICRGLQFLFAIIACGFYGNRVDADRKGDHGFAPEWIFAILIAGLSAVTALLFLIAGSLAAVPFFGSKVKAVKTYRAFAWDAILFVCWLVVFGIFAGIFLHRDSDKPYKGSSTGAMKTAVWVDFVNVVLWLVSGVYGCVKTFLGERLDRVTDKAGNKMFKKKDVAGKDGYAESV